MQGVWSAETGMYKEVHEDFEHRTTRQITPAVIFKTASKRGLLCGISPGFWA